MGYTPIMLGYTLWKYVNYMWRRFCVVYTLTIQLKEVLFFFTSRIFLFLCPCFLPSYSSFLTKLFIIAFKHNHRYSDKTFWHLYVPFLVNNGCRIRIWTQNSSLWNLYVAVTPFCILCPTSANIGHCGFYLKTTQVAII